MNGRCDKCNGRLRNGGHRTATRTLCDKCNAQFLGRAAGMAAGGGVGGAIATSGWLSRIRKARGKDGSAES
ncbi:hypothetical protein [Microbacterium gorillae]|uniref:hypothetical protein n=1 Tax=Microbacterium gorillae TaxID=1231063 RepID=UPI00058D70C0|nr:hypothetical protein [Microbacterium gorillae]